MGIIEERLNEINLDRVQKKGEKVSSREYDKDITVQHKNRKGTLPKTTSPAKKNISDAEFSDEISPIDKEKGVHNIKDEKNKKSNEDKEPVLPYDTSSAEMEEDVIERTYESKNKYDEGK